MKRILLLSLLVPTLAFAADQPNDYDLMKKAVAYSAKADAYNVYCDKDSNLALRFIDKFVEKRNISEEHQAELHAINDSELKAIKDELQEEKPTCKNLDFMMKRFQVMRELKDVSYLLNGIDPKTAEDPDIPNIEDLLPKSAQDRLPLPEEL